MMEKRNTSKTSHKQKKFFLSVHKEKIYKYFLILSLLQTTLVRAEGTRLYIFEPLIVTASKIGTTSLGTNRNIIVIEQKEIENSPTNSLADLLKNISGLQITQRGPEGIQADISIGGGTFEQTSVLIDGIKVNDPQTAHHNLNLPIQLEDIQRIEILKGPGTRLYGAGAFSGVINIITKKEERKELKLKALIGDFEFLDGHFSLSQPLGAFRNYISISGRRSDGYRYNTDFNDWNIFFKSNIIHQETRGEISLGYNDKEFGASYFYSDLYPNTREETKTAFIKSSIDFNKINTAFYWKRHHDYYILDYENPELYINDDITYIYGLISQSSISYTAGITAGGVELEQEKNNSIALGNHSRSKARFFFEHKLPDLKRLTVTFGSSLFYYSDWDWYLYPGIDIGFEINRKTYLYASIERAFRTPSYTELYINSPANIGNTDLLPERGTSFETGLKIIKGSILTNINTFLRKEKNTIDWVRTNTDDPWSATNAGEITLKGLDISTTYKSIARKFKNIPIPVISLNYTFTDINITEDPLQYKYLLNYPKHKFTFNVDYDLSSNLKQIWKGRYEVFQNSNEHFILDTSIFFEIKNSEFFIDITNLLDREYTQAGWIPMPGRWTKAGIRIKI
jgi:iron complex outermembrane receptor protein